MARRPLFYHLEYAFIHSIARIVVGVKVSTRLSIHAEECNNNPTLHAASSISDFHTLISMHKTGRVDSRWFTGSTKLTSYAKYARMLHGPAQAILSAQGKQQPIKEIKTVNKKSKLLEYLKPVQGFF